MKGRITVIQSRRGTSVRASGSAAQALFDALTKPRTTPEPKPVSTAVAPAKEPLHIQIGPLDV